MSTWNLTIRISPNTIKTYKVFSIMLLVDFINITEPNEPKVLDGSTVLSTVINAPNLKKIYIFSIILISNNKYK